MTQHTSGGGAMTPVAVIGMSCRFPGAAGPARFWRNLAAGTESVGPVPADRRPAGGTAVAARGGFVEAVDAFDAAFFGASQREAQYMDPQQRLLLELAWECLEDAGRPAADLRDCGWGVFVGAAADDFRADYLTGGALDRFGHTGTARCMLANRISHHFGLRGPSEVVDTGQSSSLTALHRAVSSLWLGECEAALVGGVQLNLLHEVTEQIGLWGGLSPDGRCHTFDGRANGYVRGEGGGCVLLKPLPAALRDGDHVYAVVRGSAVANDGGRGGLAVPSREAQYEAVTRALRVAGARPEDLAYVELHGTGTPVGDPVEARALGAAAGRARPAGNPLPVGSVKTNIGHLESAAGIAGFIKACLVLEHGALPASLNFEAPGPALDPAGLGLRVVNAYEERDFGADELVGVSSFGMGGTNVHVVLGAAPATAADPVPDPDEDADSGAVWCLSGRSQEAVRDLAYALLAELDRHPAGGPEAGFRAVAATLARRTHWEHRAAVVGADWTHFREGLAKVAAGHGFAVPSDWATAGGPDGAGRVRAAGDYVHAGRVPEISAPSAQRKLPRPVPGLPTYPFQRDRFPLPARAASHAAPGTGAVTPATATAAPAATAAASAAVPGPASDAGHAGTAYARSWAAASDAGDRLWATQVLLERELAAVLGGSVPDLDPEVSLTDLGVDSMTLLEFLDRLIEATGLTLSETVVFDHPTISEMAARVNQEMGSRHG